MLLFFIFLFHNKNTAEILNSQLPQKKDIVEAALQLVGSESLRYVHDHPEIGQSPSGFDCSGFVRFVLLESGFHIPDYIGMDDVRRPIRHANEFWDNYGASIQATPEAGDLIFFSRHGLFPTHIGIVKDEESFVHAPGIDNTKVSVSAMEPEAIVPVHGIGRILFTTNPIGFKVPTVPHDDPTYRRHQQIAD
jgi:cell wall-associated NlpC family hydrolase